MKKRWGWDLWSLSMGLFVAGCVGAWLLRVEAKGHDIHFAKPQYLILFLLLPLMLWNWWIYISKRVGRFYYSNVQDIKNIEKTGWSHLPRLPETLRCIALALLMVALMEPQTEKVHRNHLEGVDLMFVLDLSRSMEADDLSRTRLDAGQRTIRKFLRKRQEYGDRVGLVVFAQEAMLEAPLTLDYLALDDLLRRLDIGDVPEAGTAVGDALGLALSSLRRSDAKSKVIVLLSDGDSNMANVMDPLQASELAKSLDIPTFTVLLGKHEQSNGEEVSKALEIKNQHGVNPKLLQDIAENTGGEFFHAGTDDDLEKSFSDIRSSLELTQFEVLGTKPDRPLFGRLALLAFLFLMVELFCRATRWRRFQ